ncbi:MAG: hypothetical protein JOZ81_19815 [Chloroflexi bacterium]|nr:hypothetical protein [Chloroflexota bacterium]
MTTAVRGPVVRVLELGVPVAEAVPEVVVSAARAPPTPVGPAVGATCAGVSRLSEFDATSLGSTGKDAQAAAMLAVTNPTHATTAHLADLLLISDTLLFVLLPQTTAAPDADQHPMEIVLRPGHPKIGDELRSG